MTPSPPLHSTIVSMISLAAAIASNHPKLGLAYLEHLRHYGIPAAQIASVIGIARQIRQEATTTIDSEFDTALRATLHDNGCTSAHDDGCCG
jgi:hypothetical protein